MSRMYAPAQKSNLVRIALWRASRSMWGEELSPMELNQRAPCGQPCAVAVAVSALPSPGSGWNKSWRIGRYRGCPPEGLGGCGPLAEPLGLPLRRTVLLVQSTSVQCCWVACLGEAAGQEENPPDAEGAVAVEEVAKARSGGVPTSLGAGAAASSMGRRTGAPRRPRSSAPAWPPVPTWCPARSRAPLRPALHPAAARPPGSASGWAPPVAARCGASPASAKGGAGGETGQGCPWRKRSPPPGLVSPATLSSSPGTSPRPAGARGGQCQPSPECLPKAGAAALTVPVFLW